MVNVEKDTDLTSFNSFGISVKASYFCQITRVAEFLELIETPVYHQSKKLILGGGSNILFTGDFEGLVIKVALKGIEVVNEDDEKIIVRVAAGEAWHDFVMYCVDRTWGGLENLSLIPGTVGGAPIQNIGAYGIEVAEAIESVEGIDTTTGAVHSFTKAECAFGYRESAFKGPLKGKFLISSVTLTLTKKNHSFNTSYGAIHDILTQQQKNSLSVKDISDAVIQIRRSKLPDYAVLGNAGSFFKNPTVTMERFGELKELHPSMPHYHSDNQTVKLPAGWLIEQSGWKGKRIGNVGVHAQQALVLVNYGGATGNDIVQLSKQIQLSVNEKFNIQLTPEVNIV